MTTTQIFGWQIALTGDLGSFQAELTSREISPGLGEILLNLRSDMPATPPDTALIWNVPSVDMPGHWSPTVGWRRALQVDWGGDSASKATSGAPVTCLFNDAGHNRLTFACSDALHTLKLQAGVHEESATIRCRVKLFCEPWAQITEYEIAVRVDTRDIPYYEALDQVSRWWAGLPGYAPSPVPADALEPVYSTWYSFHQQVTAEGIEEQCRLAKGLGCETVIVDDGWQTDNDDRGYAYCGDWRVSPSRIADMKSHVARVHDIGMKYMLWYSVPFVGEYSDSWARFKDKFLEVVEMTGKFGVLDPRFPDVRDYLINIYETALREWDLDGFKLDFVDSFSLPKDKQHETGGGRDILSVPVAVDRLLTDVMERLRAIKPDIMIEFRQSYVGPLMRKYGNMFRVGDCPNDYHSNRIGSLDIRLICGDTATHSDMVMWHPTEDAEDAARQIIHTLFSVPQISVLLDRIPQDHVRMLQHWLGFWRAHRDILMHGRLEPLHPGAMYPAVVASTAEERIIAFYGNIVVATGADVPADLWLVNGTASLSVALRISEPLQGTITASDCYGDTVYEKEIILAAGLHEIAVPRSGIAHIRRKSL